MGGKRSQRDQQQCCLGNTCEHPLHRSILRPTPQWLNCQKWLNCVMQWILACEFMFKENASSKFSKSIPSFPRQNKRNWHTIAVQDRFTTKIKMFSVLGTDWILFKNFKCCLNIYKHCCNWITAIGKNYSATTSNNVFHVECSFEANG